MPTGGAACDDAFWRKWIGWVFEVWQSKQVDGFARGFDEIATSSGIPGIEEWTCVVRAGRILKIVSKLCEWVSPFLLGADVTPTISVIVSKWNGFNGFGWRECEPSANGQRNAAIAHDEHFSFDATDGNGSLESAHRTWGVGVASNDDVGKEFYGPMVAVMGENAGSVGIEARLLDERNLNFGRDTSAFVGDAVGAFG